jgi:hypothetical protein
MNDTQPNKASTPSAQETKRPALPRRFPEKQNPDIRQSEGWPGKLPLRYSR